MYVYHKMIWFILYQSSYEKYIINISTKIISNGAHDLKMNFYKVGGTCEHLKIIPQIIYLKD